MAEKNTGGEFHGATVAGLTPSMNSYWQPLIDSIESLQLVADPNSGRRYVQGVAEGSEVYVIPSPGGDGGFAAAPYQTMASIISSLSIMSPAETRKLEKQLGLKPTGIPANDKLNQRFLSEAAKASVANMQNAVAFNNKSINSFTSKPYTIQEQAKISAATGSLSTGLRSSKSISITQFSEGDAQAILEQFYNSTLGRRPNKKEVATFKDLINKQAKKQPSTSTTTYGADGTATTVSGGAGYSQADAQMAARQMAEADPEASAFLSATRYLDAFMNAIGSQA